MRASKFAPFGRFSKMMAATFHGQSNRRRSQGACHVGKSSLRQPLGAFRCPSYTVPANRTHFGSLLRSRPERPNPSMWAASYKTFSIGIDLCCNRIGAPMRTPSFKGLRPASEAASLAKRMNRSVDTAHEKLLRRVLWSRGLRYRKNVASLPGKPDIVFHRARVVVFCDGDFWHGRDWRRLSRQLQDRANADYWSQKIRANIIRDRRTTRLLERLDWCVVRLWEGDILADPERAAGYIENVLHERSGCPPEP